MVNFGQAGGAFGFMACIAGWYVNYKISKNAAAHMVHRWIFFAQMLASVDFPFQLPVGDISHIIKGGSTRAKPQEQFSA